MIALITGGTSGIGLEVAKILSRLNYELVIVGLRQTFSCDELKNYHYIQCDLSKEDCVYQLCEKIKEFDLDIFIDNAGFGDIGLFLDTSIEKEVEMIEINVKAVHILLKAVLKDMVIKDRGRVLVTSSLAAYACSGYMATYYATKAYSFHLSVGYQQELKDIKSNVTLSVLCPGPVSTEFEKRAHVKFTMKPISARKVAKITIKKLLKGKRIIIPTFKYKSLAFLSRLFPTLMVTKIVSKTAQRKKDES